MTATAIKIDRSANYTKQALAALLGVTPRFIEMQVKRGRGKFPKPYYIGRMPLWRGWTVDNWMDARQKEMQVT